jgi:hypothetical protein
VYRALALRPGVRRYWAVLTQDQRAPVTIVAGDGCTLGGEGIARGPGYDVRAIELRLNHDLDVGETCSFEFAVVVQPPEPDRRILPPPGWYRVVTDPGCRRLSLQLSFAPTARPSSVHRVIWRKDGQGRPGPEKWPVASDDGHFYWDLTNPRLETFGFSWRWPEALEVAAPAWGGAR